MNSALPASLTDYRGALENAIGRDVVRRRRRKVVVRWALVGAAVAAAALGALSLLSRHAAGASVVDRAAAAVAPSPGTILHVDMLGSQTNGDGTVMTWRDESWQQESPPYARRQVETTPDGSVTESCSSNTADEVYDPARNTIYVNAHAAEQPYAMDKWDIKPGVGYQAGPEARNGASPRRRRRSRPHRLDGRHHHRAGEGAPDGQGRDRVPGQQGPSRALRHRHRPAEGAEGAARDPDRRAHRVGIPRPDPGPPPLGRSPRRGSRDD